MGRHRHHVLVIIALLTATVFTNAAAQPGVDVAAPEGLPSVGRWMLTSKDVPSDWLAMADLATHLGATPPRDLPSLREALSAAHPSYQQPEQRLRRRGKLSLHLA